MDCLLQRGIREVGDVSGPRLGIVSDCHRQDRNMDIRSSFPSSPPALSVAH